MTLLCLRNLSMQFIQSPSPAVTRHDTAVMQACTATHTSITTWHCTYTTWHCLLLQAFIATHTGSVTRSYSLQLTKGKRDRLGEDAVASKLLLNALATVCSLPQSSHVDIGLLPDSEHIQV